MEQILLKNNEYASRIETGDFLVDVLFKGELAITGVDGGIEALEGDDEFRANNYITVIMEPVSDNSKLINTLKVKKPLFDKGATELVYNIIAEELEDLKEGDEFPKDKYVVEGQIVDPESKKSFFFKNTKGEWAKDDDGDKIQATNIGTRVLLKGEKLNSMLKRELRRRRNDWAKPSDGGPGSEEKVEVKTKK